MSKLVTVDNLLTTFPSALAEDKMQLALASVTATELVELYEDNDILALYARIDDLDEPLLDILAYDFKVDWWDYDYPVGIKRQLFKDSFKVHRKLGTRGSVFNALRGLYEKVNLEEWFEYGGEPYHFRVVFDITESDSNIPHDKIVQTTNITKSKRSVLEEDAVFYRTRSVIIIKSSCGYVCYATRVSGTFPNRATQGEIEDSFLAVDSNAESIGYRVKLCGTAGNIF